MKNKIVEEALSWLDTPYQHHQRCKGGGVDCGQLVIAACEDSGAIPHGAVEPGAYCHDWHCNNSEELYLGFVTKLCEKVDQPQAGDIELFSYGRCISHGGIMLDDNRLIHSYITMGVVVSTLDDAIFKRNDGTGRLMGFWRLRGL